MLNELEAIALSLDMPFQYGEAVDLEAFTKQYADEGSGFLLFHEGFFLANLNQDGQGALEYRHQLSLLILTRSDSADDAVTRGERLTSLDEKMRLLYKALTKAGQVSNARAQMGLNLTSTNLDAIRLTLTLLPDAVPLCRS